MREASLGQDNVELYASRNGKKWKNQIKRRMEMIREWEENIIIIIIIINLFTVGYFYLAIKKLIKAN